MDCFYHNAVPSVAPCRGCRKPVCASCRNENGDCPGCVLAARIDAAKQTNQINGGVGPSYGTYQEPPPRGAAYQEPPPGTTYQEPPPRGAAYATPEWEQQAAPPPRVRRQATVAVRPETRALVALGYPFWPLALIALLDSRAAHFVKRQAWQALGFNLGMWGLGAILSATAAVPILSFGAWPLLPFIMPIWVVASVVYAFKVFNGEDVNVPIVSDWVDARLPGASPQAQQS
jgi:uncharacterized membrane protein